MSAWRGLALAGWLLTGLMPVHAQLPRPLEEPDLIVGRADADASGGWPVAVLVTDGARRLFTVRAPREQLGKLPGREWRAVDPDALMSLEHYGAPQLILQPDFDGCWTELSWGRRAPALPSHYRRPLRPELAHAACAGARCNGVAEAWQIELTEDDGPGLPLARLLPQLGLTKTERLVLYATGRDYATRAQGVKQLLPPPRRDQSSVPMSPEYWLPAEVAAQFPALHVAMLDGQSRAQGLATGSIVELAEPIGPAGLHSYIEHWGGNPAQRQALGFGPGVTNAYNLTRLLLRLSPDDPLQALVLTDVHDHTRFADFKAIAPATASPVACEQRLQALQCAPACEERSKQVRANPENYFFVKEPLSGKSADSYEACTASCEQQKSRVRATVQRYYASTAEERQRHAWKFYEWMTGQPASAGRP